MAAPANIPWTDLFASKSLPDFTLELRVIKKSGHPFLFVPLSSPLAAQALSLYPAQTSVAKWAKKFLAVAFQSRFPLPLEKTSTPLSTQDAFSRFLAGLVDGHSLPPLAILAGNAHTEGRRFLILLFDEKCRSAKVVKAGIGDSARRLIRHEDAFLNSAPSGVQGLPLLRASFDTEYVSAFALNFTAGDSPEPEAWPALGELLSSWVSPARQIQLRDVPAWQALAQTCSADPLFTKITDQLADFSFHPAIFHGDFAPWNIKVSPHTNTWTVLDWERGDLIGIPGWDWFHYIIQSGILVRKQTPEQLLQTIDKVFANEGFQNYARLAGVRGHERPLLIAYLLHLIAVIQPSEGIEANKSVLRLLSQR